MQVAVDVDQCYSILGFVENSNLFLFWKDYKTQKSTHNSFINSVAQVVGSNNLANSVVSVYPYNGKNDNDNYNIYKWV